MCNLLCNFGQILGSKRPKLHKCIFSKPYPAPATAGGPPTTGLRVGYGVTGFFVGDGVVGAGGGVGPSVAKGQLVASA